LVEFGVGLDLRSLIARMILIDRRMAKFLREPVSTRGAAAAIVTSTLVVVVERCLDEGVRPPRCQHVKGCGGPCRP
jgi:hypothetical protein